MIVSFGIRNCKARGILIESIDVGNGRYFFKYHNQLLVSHCTQIQNIVRAANVKQSRTMQVDIAEFIHEYYNTGQNTVWFRGIKLVSKCEQIDKTFQKRLNIDVGIEKRKLTMAEKKAAKAVEKQQQTNQFNANLERMFQEERAKRIAAVHSENAARVAAQAANKDIVMNNSTV